MALPHLLVCIASSIDPSHRYQAAIAGRKANGFGGGSDPSSASSSNESDSDTEVDGQVNGKSSANKRDPNSVPVIKSRKQREKIAKFAEMSKLRSQWESGNIRPIADDEEDEEPRKEDTSKEDLIKLRQRLCLGRSESMRQVFEKAAREGASALNPVQRSSTQLIDVTIKAGSIKVCWSNSMILEQYLMIIFSHFRLFVT